MKNILVVNVNWVGDVIFSSPVFKALKREYPNAKIICLAPPRVKDVLESIAQVDEIITYDEEEKDRSPFAKLSLIGRLRLRKFDTVFLLHRSYTRALLTFLAGIPIRVGYNTKGRGLLLTHKFNLPENTIHRSDHYLNVIESYGVKVQDRTTDLTVSVEQKEDIKSVLKEYGIHENDPLVVINPGGNWDLKRWPKENFRKLVEILAEQLNLKVIVSGAAKDFKLAEYVANKKANNFAGKIGLKPLMALMHRALVVVSADTGPIHIASSVGTDVVGIWGPTRPEITSPRGKGKIVILQHDVGCNQKPCYYLECKDNVCMHAVTVKEVVDVIRKIRY